LRVFRKSPRSSIRTGRRPQRRRQVVPRDCPTTRHRQRHPASPRLNAASPLPVVARAPPWLRRSPCSDAPPPTTEGPSMAKPTRQAESSSASDRHIAPPIRALGAGQVPGWLLACHSGRDGRGRRPPVCVRYRQPGSTAIRTRSAMRPTGAVDWGAAIGRVPLTPHDSATLGACDRDRGASSHGRRL
jgi:hypothetical protein